jgi:UDP-N-acetylmuramoyl-tripeptide--D-alanyl-D-alanine ligase
MSLEQAAAAAKARILYPAEIMLTGAASDNRNILPGQLFVAIRGEHSDGHNFAHDAVKNGAAAVLAERDPFDGTSHVPVLLVDDSVKALGRIGRIWRDSFHGRLAGITGTAGKTTTKELLAHILEQHGKTARNRLNLNTQIGMPISMLATDGDEDFWVMEAGISHPQDMDELGSVMDPDLAIILNAGAGHSLGLGNRGTAWYKARLLHYLRPQGIALVCADYKDLAQEALAIRQDILFFSTTRKDVPYQASYLGLDETGRGNYRLYLRGTELTVNSALTGPYAAENILAAAAAAHCFELTCQEIKDGIAGAELPAQRFAKYKVNGWTVIDDTYNANPLSARRMIEAAAELAANKPFLCVMGEMRELGERADEEHRILGTVLAKSGCCAVFWLGNHARELQAGLADEHYEGYFSVLSSPEDFLSSWQDWQIRTQESDTGLILFKGSRSNRLERFVNLFMEHHHNSHAL